jgi:hypothetical protein
MSEFPAWSGGKQNLEKVIEKGQIDELDSLVEELYYDNTPTEGELNDLLWFGLDEIDEFKHLWDTESWVLQSEEDGEIVYFVSADEMPTEDVDKAAHFDSEEAADEARINIADVKWPNGSWEVVSTFDLDESVKEAVNDDERLSYLDIIHAAPKGYDASYVTDLEQNGQTYSAWQLGVVDPQTAVFQTSNDKNLYDQVVDALKQKYPEDDIRVISRRYKYAPEISSSYLLIMPENDEVDESVKEDAPAQGSAEDEIKQWRIPNPLGIDTIFVGTKKAAEEYGKKYGFTPEEVQ